MAFLFMNGALIPEAEASLSPFDRGFIYGDGIFETIKVENGTIELLYAHTERLMFSASELRIPVPETPWDEIIAELIDVNNLGSKTARVKIILTRGIQPGLNLACPNGPTLIITAVEQAPIKKPERIGIYPEQRSDPVSRHKSLNFLFNLVAREWAAVHGFDEALLLGKEGEILECSMANIFIKRDNTLFKPMNEGYYLEGIMAAHFLRAQEGLGVKTGEMRFFPADIRDTDEIYITNSMIGACRVKLDRKTNE